MQAHIWIGILIGSTIGTFIPDLWGAAYFLNHQYCLVVSARLSDCGLATT